MGRRAWRDPYAFASLPPELSGGEQSFGGGQMSSMSSGSPDVPSEGSPSTASRRTRRAPVALDPEPQPQPEPQPEPEPESEPEVPEE